MNIMRVRKEKRTEQMPIRFSPNERAAVERVAASEHEYPSSFMRKIVMQQIASSTRVGKSEKSERSEKALEAVAFQNQSR